MRWHYIFPSEYYVIPSMILTEDFKQTLIGTEHGKSIISFQQQLCKPRGHAFLLRHDHSLGVHLPVSRFSGRKAFHVRGAGIERTLRTRRGVNVHPKVVVFARENYDRSARWSTFSIYLVFAFRGYVCVRSFILL